MRDVNGRSMTSLMATEQIEVIRDLDSASRLRPAWQSMTLDPNADIDFYAAIIQARKDVLRPHVVALRSTDGKVESILAGRLERQNLEVSVGYKKVRLPSCRCLTLVHGGLMGDASQNHVRRLIRSVQSSLRNGEADLALFHALDVPSPLHEVAHQAGGVLTRDHFPTRIERWKLRLPQSYDQLLRGLSSNTKHNLKRYSKRLTQAYGNKLLVRSYKDPTDLEWVLSDTEAIAGKTYHRGLGVGFIFNEETRRIMTLASDRGWLRAHVLYIANRPCAFWNGFLYRRTFFTATTGYDPDLTDYRPGTYLLQKMLEALCSEATADEVDFGFGAAQYKRDWCRECQIQSSFFLFAPTTKGVLLNCLRSPLIALSEGARQVLTRTGMVQKVKKLWRHRLATNENLHQSAPAEGQ